MYYNQPNPYNRQFPYNMHGGYPPQGQPPFYPPYQGPQQGFPPFYQQPSPFYHQQQYPQQQFPQGQYPQGQFPPFFTNKDGSFGFDNLTNTMGNVMKGYNTLKQMGSMMSFFK
ncbi:hypothetical protein EV207_10492 [Scopulibacillus darangshiensis]|uniref:YppG-like protein n=1 Tax=Scopulibacillus darangshiensis TaxID=442528 RepID=A0A4R2P7N2_9BACL|nr:hypothetical protein EV207_10492 [Scopulibacillus darangshiensis]